MKTKRGYEMSYYNQDKKTEFKVDRLHKNSKEKNKDVTKIGCPIAEQCAGCLGQKEAYPIHLQNKKRQIDDLLEGSCKCDPIIEMETPYHYKKKVQAVFGHDKNGIPIYGVKKQGLGKIVSVEQCPIEDKKAAAIVASIRDLLKSFQIKTFDENSGYGLLRYVSVRCAAQTGEIMVVLVLSSLILPSKNNFVKALRKIHPEIRTVIINENYKKTNVVLGEKETVIFGKGFIKDILLGKEFRISSKSFYPTNPIQAERLYQKAITYGGLTGKETVIDAYSGIGTIGILVSDHVKKVLSVEQNPDAIRDGISNCKFNKIENIDSYTMEASEFMKQVAETSEEKIDVVFLDPPKAGCDPSFFDALATLNPRKVVYISRNIISLARDLSYLKQKGYQVKRAGGVDMAPWRENIDIVLLLQKK